MKRFIVIISALFCFALPQDIAGSWTLTAVDVYYYNFARPNPLTADASFGENQYATPLYINDTYGIGVSEVLAWLPPGGMFLGVQNGPFGEAGLAANGVSLNVTLANDGTGIIPEGSTYPDIELDEEICTTYGQVLAVTDNVIYASDKDAGLTLPSTNIVGQPSLNPYAGETVGSMSLQQSVVFSYFPGSPVHDWTPFPLFFGASEGDAGAVQVAADTWIVPGTSLTPNENGVFNTVGTTGGYIKTDGFGFTDSEGVERGSIGDNDPYDIDLPGCEATEPPSCTQVGEAFSNPVPELALYWHSVDGYSADTGFGDDGLDSDEDGDGTDWDRIFGLPAISSTYMDPTFAASVGFGNFDYMVAGDITGPVRDLLFDGCIDQVSAEVEGQCSAVLAGGIAQATATCQSYADMDTTGGDGLFVVLYAGCLGDCFDPTGQNDTCGDEAHGACAGAAAQGVAAYGSCENWASDYVLSGPGGAAGATVTYLANTIVAAMDPSLLDSCYGAAQQTGSEATAVGVVCNGLCLGAGFDQDSCDLLVGLVTDPVDGYGIQDCATLDAQSGVLTSAAGGLVTSVDDDESGDNCGEWALSVADSFAAQSAETGYMTCTDLADGSIAAYTKVTTTDDYSDPTKVNNFYVMNPDDAYATWSYFVTFNSVAYGLTGDSAFLVDDSGYDLDYENDFAWVSLATGTLCDPASGDPYCAPYSAAGGRLVMSYSPTCVPVIESMEVQTEFLGFEDGECTHDGDVTGDNATNVLDVVAIVQAVIGNQSLTDDQACRADINEDTFVNVLDVVAIVQSIVNGRDGAPASSVEFIRTSQGLEMNADGVVDAVQLTLSHGDNFSIELTDNAFVAEYSTKDNQTTLMVVAPEGNEIFTASGEYTIDEMIAANKDGYVPTSQPVSFNLSEAYPNPFNPSTSLEISLNVASNVSITAYNVMGQLVSTIHDGNMDAGTHAITWNASNVASGMYIIKAEAAGKVINQKVMLLK